MDFTWGELRWFAVAALAAGVVPFGQWARWQLRAWRIRRAIARSDYDHADLLALNQDEEEGPRSLRGLLTGIAFMAIGTPALIVFQINFADELGRMLGEGWSYVALPIAFGLVTTCAWMWQRVKRNAMSPEELAAIEGFDEELAEELQSRAQEAIDRQEAAHREARRELGVEDALAELPHLTEAMLVTLGKAGLKTLDDVADLATDELIQKKREAPRRRNNADGPPMRRPSVREQDKGGVLGEYGLTEEQGNEIIMAARAHWFEDEEEAPAPAETTDKQEAADADSTQ